MLALIGVTTLQELRSRTHTDDVSVYLRLQLAMDTLLWTTLYLVKAAFLALMWCVFKVSAGFRKAWWIVTVYTFITFWIIFLSRFWQCGGPSTYDVPEACNLDFLLQDQKAEILIAFTLHISSDIFIIMLPVAQIRKLSMRMGRKISVAAVFAIIIVVTAIGIVRNVATVVASLGSPTDASEIIDVICTTIEPALAVLVCSLPPYKALIFNFKPHRSDSSDVQQPAILGGGWWKPEKLSQFTNFPGPLLQVSILQEQPVQRTEQCSEHTDSLLGSKTAQTRWI